MSFVSNNNFNVEVVPIDSLTTDNANPNVMTLAQEKALEESIRRFGILKPAVVNKSGLIADGEHGWRIAKKIGFTEYPVVRLDVDEVDRRILRQVLNKLHGEHLPELDIQEFSFFQENDALEELAKLLAKDEQDLLKFMNGIEEPLVTPGALKEVAFEAHEKVCPKCGFKL